VGQRLKAIGVHHVDVSGAGGTSWVAVETHRAADVGDKSSHALGQAFWDWGIPTGASVGLMADVGFETIVATGGITTGLDVARALALGATVAGIARPALKALHEGGRAGVMDYFDHVERELKATMLLTGSIDLASLRKAPRMLVGELREWLHGAHESL
jgi:isopentenyl-diphosphate delta-isomerase